LDYEWERLKRVSEESGIAIYLTKERSGGDFEAVRMGLMGFELRR